MANAKKGTNVRVNLHEHPKLLRKLNHIESKLKVPAEAVVAECLRMVLGKASKKRKTK